MEDVVDLHIALGVEDLEVDLMRRQQLPDDLFPAEEKEARDVGNQAVALRFDQSERLRDFLV